MKIGILTGGGDCPGLNAIIQAAVVKASQYGFEVYGVKNGYEGLIKGEVQPLRKGDVEGVYAIGGTMLGTSRKNPAKSEEDIKRVVENVKKFQLDAVIAVGGDDTLGAAQKLYERGVPIVGVPKTIDNDLSATDYSVGFWTAVDIIAESLHRLHTTAKSHRRVIIAEIMGRYAGWLALMGGLAGGAHIILIPEKPLTLQQVCDIVKKRKEEGKEYTIIAVSEGYTPPEMGELVAASTEKDEYGHIRLGGIAKFLEEEIKKRTGIDTRSVILGHVQRGGPPNAYDRVLGIRLGYAAVDLVKEKKFGYAVVLRGTQIVPVKLSEVVGQMRKVSEEFFDYLGVFEK
ncbi:MAG: ATP-dependent 6-phosphofructokinase [Nitrososphaerota archaeon]|nr:ATP-dependent 6-phosphofructokinase [Nitrososphaerota archaeon]